MMDENKIPPRDQAVSLSFLKKRMFEEKNGKLLPPLSDDDLFVIAKILNVLSDYECNVIYSTMILNWCEVAVHYYATLGDYYTP